MPVDLDAAVIANTRLSAEYNVISLAAPAIAVLASPGQFVMVKPARGTDPLLRRPFSIFEILRDASGESTGISILNKRIGVGTRRLYDVEEGGQLAVLGPLGRPFEPIVPPGEAWMTAGGVGLAPFLTLAEALRDAGTRTTLFYGARRASELYYVDSFERLGVRVVLATEDGSRGLRGYVTAALGDALNAGMGFAGGGAAAIKIYACGPTPMMEAVARLAASHGRPCDVSLEQTMGCGLGGCYSCVVPVKRRDDSSSDLSAEARSAKVEARSAKEEHANLVRSCISGPVFDGAELVWD
jgi:dihydroorotate dehydrogenase electron transfer subunit